MLYFASVGVASLGRDLQRILKGSNLHRRKRIGMAAGVLVRDGLILAVDHSCRPVGQIGIGKGD
jgi:hypothetical protein